MSDVAIDAPFWAAAREGRLSLQRCDGCGFIRWPAAGVCPECLSRASAWVDVDGAGTVWSVVVYHRAYSKTGLSPIPYNVALVELDCGARLITRLVEVDPHDAGPGTRVSVRFAEVADHGIVPVFVPSDSTERTS